MEAPSTSKSLLNKTCYYGAILLAVLAMASKSVEAHGRLLQPPSRSTMWRFGFRTPPNYNDHELFCGGLSRLQLNRGRCGICGDPWDIPPPRPNEAGGLYGNGIIVQRYKASQVITAEVELTANHRGFFEFKICPTNNRRINPSQKCFDQNVLRLADRKSTRYFVTKRSPNQVHRVRLQLPKGMRCNFCIIQWNYVAGNNWGTCPNGEVGMGCGPQETFRACSDVSIGAGRFWKRTAEEGGNTTMGIESESMNSDDTDMDISAVAVPTCDTIAIALTVALHFILKFL
ncbi:hypothetical protein CHUAL_003396 [Chamberlinius hualienensis]